LRGGRQRHALLQHTDRQTAEDIDEGDDHCRHGIAPYEFARTVHRSVEIGFLRDFLSALAGLVYAARLNSAQPALGVGYELDAIAAVVIGGTSLSGGEGTILGTIIGAFIISTLTNGLRIMNVPQEWQFVVTGVIVILAVYLDILRRRRG